MLSWFRRRAQIRTTRKNVNFAAGLVQQLESRTLLAATVSASANSITFTGSTGDDTIAVSTDGTNFLLNGVDTTFAIAGRQYINVSGGDGNDTISLNDNLGTRIGLLYGGNGEIGRATWRERV